MIDLVEEIARMVELTPRQEVSDYMKTDKEFMDGIRRGAKDCKAGDKRLWSDVKKEIENTMSDGMTDAANKARRKAIAFAKERFASLRTIHSISEAPPQETVVFIYEEHLDHIIEILANRVVAERYYVPIVSDSIRKLEVDTSSPAVSTQRGSRAGCLMG